jgi:23S rRNA (cytosine1962-C5)-methyltransferase
MVLKKNQRLWIAEKAQPRSRIDLVNIMRQAESMIRHTAFRPPSPPAKWLESGLREEFEKAGTTAHRLATGGDGWVERLGDDVMISHKNEVVLTELVAGLSAWTAKESWKPARVFTRFLPLKNADRVSPVLHSGDETLPVTTVVTEAGIRYGLDFATGYSHGLFLDQRANRAKLAVLRPKKLLNTFAYTCSFSVVAALGGAETLSVDLSRKSLDRGKQNLALNGIAETKHRFVADDTLELLPKLAQRGERFDSIILDPPTFSRGNNGRLWQVEQHFEDLLRAALEVAGPKCAILLSTNCTKMDEAGLERQARACAKLKRRTADYSRTNTPADFPVGEGAKTVWMMVR